MTLSLPIKLAIAVGVGLITLALTLFWREFPMRLALISGIAVGVLAFSTLQAIGRLSNVYRR
jgi:hypothetical protein